MSNDDGAARKIRRIDSSAANTIVEGPVPKVEPGCVVNDACLHSFPEVNLDICCAGGADMLFSEEEVETIVKTAQKVVTERFDILKTTATASRAVWTYLQMDQNCCTQACNFVDQLCSGPMTADKVFIADLAIAVTRVWEAFTKTDEGGRNRFYKFSEFQLTDKF